MAYYSYKDLCYSIPPEYEAGFEAKYGRGFDGDSNYDGDYWVIASDYVEDLKAEIASLKLQLAGSGEASFEEVCKPLIKWLNINGHPHMTSLITSTGAELVEGVKGFQTLEFVKD